MTEEKSSGILIHGLGLSGYRSFATGKFERIGPFRKVNAFVGQNNCGKSNILRFIWQHYGLCFGKNASGVGNFRSPQIGDHYQRKSENGIVAEIAIKIDSDWGILDVNNSNHGLLLRRLLTESELMCKDGLVFLQVPVKSMDDTFPNIQNPLTEKLHAIEKFDNDYYGEFKRAFRTYFAAEASPRDQNLVFTAINALREHARQTLVVPEIYYIPQFRQILDAAPSNKHSDQMNDEQNQRSCSGLAGIHELSMLQNPGHEHMSSEELHDARRKFERIQQFFRQLVGDENATLQANHKRDTIIVDVNGKVDTLQSLGAGIHQVMLIAIVVSQKDDCVFCIEEPENHMHPTLLRKLVHYLQSQTTNQYFISTHSPILIDLQNCAVFQVQYRLEENRSVVRSITAHQDAYDAAQDLGFRPSDLLQSNCVIWVEGPSDRIYLRNWITRTDPELLENCHYSFVIYGGALKSYLDASETVDSEPNEGEAIKELIKTRRICRSSIFLTDRDRTANGKMTARNRVLKMAFGNNGVFWETNGMTIENYLPGDFLVERLSEIVQLTVQPTLDVATDWSIKDFRKLVLDRKTKKPKNKQLEGKDKVALADKAVNHKDYDEKIWSSVTAMQTQLREKTLEICTEIRRANGLPHKAAPEKIPVVV